MRLGFGGSSGVKGEVSTSLEDDGLGGVDGYMAGVLVGCGERLW